jgi:hypothetical protein
MKKAAFQSALIATIALALPQAANATLLVGFHNFDGTANAQTTTSMTDPTDVGFAQSGFSGTVTKPVTDGASVDTTGSSDTTFGTYTGAIAPANDGAGRMASGNITFSLTKLSGGSIALDTLFFDIARAGTGGTVTIAYQIRNSLNALVGSGSVASALPINSDYATNGGNWRDYALDLTGIGGGLTLAANHTISFVFTGNPNFRNDNVAISAIPEPASLLALGCVLGSGLMVRNRRSRPSLV